MTEMHRAEPVLRSGDEEREYLLDRAEDHRRRAEEAQEADVRAIHRRFERRYRARAARVVMVHFGQTELQKGQERTSAQPVDASEPAVLVRSGRNARP